MTSATHLSSRSCWDNIFDPEGATDSSCCAQTGYWITFFVLGLLTAFIPHLIYHLCKCCDDNPKAPLPTQSRRKVRAKPRNHGLPPLDISTVPPVSKAPPLPPSTQGTKTSSSIPPPSATVTMEELGAFTIPPILTSYSLPPSSHSSIATSHSTPSAPQSPVEMLEQSRRLQNILPKEKPLYMPKGCLPLTHQCVLALAKNPHLASVKTLHISTSDLFDATVSVVFRFYKYLRADQLRNILDTWLTRGIPKGKFRFGQRKIQIDTTKPIRPGNDRLNLTGCTHLTLDPGVLVHTSFKILKLAGCQFADIRAFANALSQQKELFALDLGLEAELSVAELQKIMAHATGLTRLELAILGHKELPFTAPNQLTELTLRVPTLTTDILKNILEKCSNLKQLTLWCTDSVDASSIKAIVKSYKKSSLKQLCIVQDAPRATLIKNQDLIDGVRFKTIPVNTATIFGASGKFEECNSDFYGFYFLLKRFVYQAEKFHLLLKHIALMDHHSNGFQKLQSLAKHLAEVAHMGDFADLALHFTPFELALDEAAPKYNCNLEWLLRSTLQICLDKHAQKIASKEEEGSTFYSNNAHMIAYLLANHQSTFSTSSAIIQSS